MVQDFILIPVIDLKGGVVVHARAGERAQYRPIETPLGAAHDPVGIARELLAITGSPALYVADLDAILGTGNHFDMCRELADALPGTDLWIDAGFGDVTDCAFWLPLGANLVVGSESLLAIDNWHDLHAVFGHRGLNNSRSHRIAADSPRPVLAGDMRRQCGEPAFGRRAVRNNALQQNAAFRRKLQLFCFF